MTPICTSNAPLKQKLGPAGLSGLACLSPAKRWPDMEHPEDQQSGHFTSSATSSCQFASLGTGLPATHSSRRAGHCHARQSCPRSASAPARSLGVLSAGHPGVKTGVRVGGRKSPTCPSQREMAVFKERFASISFSLLPCKEGQLACWSAAKPHGSVHLLHLLGWFASSLRWAISRLLIRSWRQLCSRHLVHGPRLRRCRLQGQLGGRAMVMAVKMFLLLIEQLQRVLQRRVILSQSPKQTLQVILPQLLSHGLTLTPGRRVQQMWPLKGQLALQLASS